MSVLQTLAGLYIYTEWRTGPDDTNVDNVVLVAAGTAVGDEIGAPLTVNCSPNPFNPRTTIHFDLPAAGPVRLAVYDVAGRLVRVLVEGETPAGSHEAVWDGRDASDRAMASGSYLARLVAGGKGQGVRLSLVR
jgi:flagellar hook assembly protein FlgD